MIEPASQVHGVAAPCSRKRGPGAVSVFLLRGPSLASPGASRGAGGCPDHQQRHPGGDVADSLDGGQGPAVVCGDTEGERRLLRDEALNGFSVVAAALAAVAAVPMARMLAYLDFAAAHPRVYEAMFSMQSGLAFAADDTPEPLRRAFAGVRDAFPDADGTRAEVVWSLLHGLATLQAGGRLPPDRRQARLDLAHQMLSPPEEGELR
jgi:hypothetical protein